jgi:hypothetical protein
MKKELGLYRFEGRSWRGFHHHACLVMLAYGFLALGRLPAKRSPAKPGEKGIPSRWSACRRSVGGYKDCRRRFADMIAPTADQQALRNS